MTTGTPQVCGTWTDDFESNKGWTFTAGGGVANRAVPYATNCSGTCVTGGARGGTNVINLANCGNYATTYATITLTLCSAGVFSGYYKIGSESTYDLFNYAIDAIPVRGTNTIASGCNNNWTAFNINVPAGTHTIYLGYCTDVSVTANGGKVWLDDVQCTNVELSPATFVSNTYTDFNNVIVSVPPLPTITASAVNSCPGTLSFTTTVGVTPGYTFLWSAPAVSGQTPTISSSTSPSPTITFPNATASPITFTVNCQITTPCCGVLGTATRTITINPIPVVPTAANVATCTGGSATLTATAPSGVTFTWYNVPSGGSALAVGPTYNIASCPSGVTNYYVEAENAQGCQSARTLVTLTGTALSTPTAGAFTTPCVGGSTTLSVTCPTCPIGTIFSWWNAPTGGTTYGNGDNIATIAINAPTTYYAEAESPNGCHSARTPITITPGAVTPPTATPFARCGAGQVDLSVNPIAGATSYNWYNVSMGGVALQSNLSLQFSPTIATTTTYYVSVTLAGCSESARTSVTGTILPPQATVYWTGNISNSWFNPNNWYPVGCLPDCGINADIQANRPPAAGGGACPNQPTIPSYPTHAECQNITIGTGATLTFGAPDAYLGVCGNWSQAGTVTMTQGTVEFQGIVGNQNYTRTGAGNLYNVIINNTSGTATVTLNNDMVLSNGGTLVFSSGRIVTGANEVYVMNGSLTAILGHGINSYVQGNLRREITQIGAYEFPVGLAPASKGYQRSIIDFSNIGSIRRLRAFFILHPILPSALNIAECGTTFNCDPFDNGKWVIDAFNAGGASISGSDAIYSPTLYPRTVTNYCPGAAGYTVMKQPTGAGNSWNMYGTCDPTSTSARITRLNITNGFSEFGVEQSTTPLPVDFLSLTANPINNQYIAVKWITEKEFENVGFELERSLDGHQYQKITWVDGNGTSQVQHTYGYDDKNVNANNLYYYRLKQIDSNGGFRYSNVVSAMINSNELGIQLYPNPTSGQLNIDFFTPEDDILQAKVINVLGQEVLKKQFTAKKGPQTFILDISGIAEGTYTVVLSNSTKTITQKVVKTK
ncbi:MAG: T9SS type A sorting domain-containing protein [Bacteroidia bacterium]|nr:T9SS type A sorting domain-containing protein [Bacteroidia bacterium]